MEYQQVTDSVTIAVNEYGSNLVCLELEDELIFVDAGLLTSYTAKFRKAMEARTQKSASTLIMTHAHLDHLFGMGVFKDCNVVAAEASKPRFERFVTLEYNEEVIRDRERVFPHFRKAAAQAKLRMPTRAQFYPHTQLLEKRKGNLNASLSPSLRTNTSTCYTIRFLKKIIHDYFMYQFHWILPARTL
jgi:mRNA degradation ribonuclease J1/J2